MRAKGGGVDNESKGWGWTMRVKGGRWSMRAKGGGVVNESKGWGSGQ